MPIRARKKCWLFSVCEDFWYFIKTGKIKSGVRISAGRADHFKNKRAKAQLASKKPDDHYQSIKTKSDEPEMKTRQSQENKDGDVNNILNLGYPLTNAEIYWRTAEWVEQSSKETFSRRLCQQTLQPSYNVPYVPSLQQAIKLSATKEAKPREKGGVEYNARKEQTDVMNDLTEKTKKISLSNECIQTDEFWNDIYLYKTLKNSSSQAFKRILRWKYENPEGTALKKPKSEVSGNIDAILPLSPDYMNTKSTQTDQIKYEVFMFEKLKSCARVEFMMTLEEKFCPDTEKSVTEFESSKIH